MSNLDFSEVYIHAYRSFSDRMHEGRYSAPTDPKWFQKPESISGFWMPYFMMLDDYARNLSNTVNVFGYNIEKLRAWHSVLLTQKEENIDQILFEFVDNLFVIAMHTPHTVRDRFMFFGAQLSHMANRCLPGNWIDDLPEDRKIKIEVIAQSPGVTRQLEWGCRRA